MTEETLEEARLLRLLWDERPHPGQAEFGERYEIGNQSAVGQFLRGQTPLSLKAAAGFAAGLSCSIVDFSPRLADQAKSYADLSGLDEKLKDLTDLSKNEMRLVLLYRDLPPDTQDRVMSQLMVLAGILNKNLSTTAKSSTKSIQKEALAKLQVASQQVQEIALSHLNKLEAL